MKQIFILSFLLIALIGFYWFYTYKREYQNKDEIVLYGNIDVRQVDLGFRVMGRVQSMPYQEGDLIKKGTLVAFLDKQPYADRLVEAVARASASKALLQNAENNLERRAKIKDTMAVSKEDYENAVYTKNQYQAEFDASVAALGVAQTNLNDTECFAPNDGIILTRIREPGAVVREADPVYTLSLLDPVWVRAFIPGPLLGLVYPGMAAEITTDTPGGSVYEGHVGFISPVAEFTPKTVETTQLRTDLVYRLRIIAKNPDKFLRQGMPVTVRLKMKKDKE